MAKNLVAKEHRSETPRQNGLKWVLIFILLILGIAANYYFNKVPGAILLAGWIILLCILGGIAVFTKQGQQAIQFAKEARVELRKVFWPSRQETIRTTFVVMGLVVLVALILWGVDSVVMGLIGLVTGQ